MKDLRHVRSQYTGQRGRHGEGTYRMGKNGSHVVVKVPLGTLIWNSEGQLLSELSLAGEAFIGAHGGLGGHGNHFFLSNDNKEPTEGELGQPGQRSRLLLEMRLLADVGLVGFPNAGKSTLLRCLSRARPKVASYPFTTIAPHIGVIQFDDSHQIAVADLPGILPGAHRNYGLGIQFLRHIERCTSLLFVLDPIYQDPGEQLKSLRYEINMYSPKLEDLPFGVCINKLDLMPMAKRIADSAKGETTDAEARDECERSLKLPACGQQWQCAVSARLRTNIDKLLPLIRSLTGG